MGILNKEETCRTTGERQVTLAELFNDLAAILSTLDWCRACVQKPEWCEEQHFFPRALFSPVLSNHRPEQS